MNVICFFLCLLLFFLQWRNSVVMLESKAKMSWWLVKARSRCRFSLSSALHDRRFIFFSSRMFPVHSIHSNLSLSLSPSFCFHLELQMLQRGSMFTLPHSQNQVLSTLLPPFTPMPS